MNSSTLSQTSDFLRNLFPCRLTGRTLDFESSNAGSNPAEEATALLLDLADELDRGFTWTGNIISDKLATRVKEYAKHV